MIYTYLGPAGTFTEAALLQVPDARTSERIPAANVNAALEKVRSGAADAAMVPIENSVEGGVSTTLDAIATGDALQIVAEALVPITFVLAVRENIDSLEQIRTVSTHGHAWAQCRGWAESNIPQAEFIPASSTAAGAIALLDGESNHDAAICSPLVAQERGLKVLREEIEDYKGAVTRFILVTRPGPIPAPTGIDKSTVILPLAEDRPGALMEILEQFVVRGVNLSRIESRPTGEGMGQLLLLGGYLTGTWPRPGSQTRSPGCTECARICVSLGRTRPPRGLPPRWMRTTRTRPSTGRKAGSAGSANVCSVRPDGS